MSLTKPARIPHRFGGPFSKIAQLLLTTALFLIYVGRLVAAEAEYAFSQGAYGFYVEELNNKLQERLGEAAEKIVPTQTRRFTAATETNLLRALSAAGVTSPRPVAGPSEYAALGLSWPDDVARCFQLIDAFEGTLFSTEGPAQSGDTRPMVTYGLVGFTSHDLSLQRFFFEADTLLEGALTKRVKAMMGEAKAAKFALLLRAGQPGTKPTSSEKDTHNAAFVAWALQKPMGSPRVEVKKCLDSFRTISGFPQIQLRLAKRKCWDDEALTSYVPLIFPGRTSVSLQGMLFCLDMTVLTNGLPRADWDAIPAAATATEVERLQQVREAMTKTHKYDRSEGKRRDILKREDLIIKGSGDVHGRPYDLMANGIIPRS